MIEVALKERGVDLMQFFTKTKDQLRKFKHVSNGEKCNCGCEDIQKPEKGKLTPKRIAAGAWSKFQALVKKKIKSMFRDFVSMLFCYSFFICDLPSRKSLPEYVVSYLTSS